MKLPTIASQRQSGGSATGTKKPSEIEPPKEPFINLSNTGPVDPARFQRFIVPMEFVEKANALDLSQVGTDELPSSDAKPRGAEEPLLPDARADAHQPLAPPSATRIPDQATTQLIARRPVSAFSRWRLSGKMPMSLRIGVAAVVVLGCASLIWFLRHTQGSGLAIETDGLPESTAALARPRVTPAPIKVTPAAIATVAPRLAVSQSPAAPETSSAVFDIDTPDERPVKRRPFARSIAVTGSRKSASKSEGTPITPTTPSSVSPAPSIKGVLPVFQPE